MREKIIPFVALVIAALLEVGGDALVRYGLRGAAAPGGRLAGFALGAVVLFAYSLSVNAPRWDFGRLLGIYIAVFFVVSQAVAALVFKEPIRTPTYIAGALIVAGGFVLTFWQAR